MLILLRNFISYLRDFGWAVDGAFSSVISQAGMAHSNRSTARSVT